MYDTIPSQYLDRFLEQGYSGRIIDLRDRQSYLRGHIFGAENFPYDELMQNPDVLTGEQTLLFYCARGSESLLACNYYSRLGYSVFNVGNGMNYYRGKYMTAR